MPDLSWNLGCIRRDWFFLAREPATAIAETTVANLPKSIANEPVRLKNGVLAERPPKADPLLPPLMRWHKGAVRNHENP